MLKTGNFFPRCRRQLRINLSHNHTGLGSRLCQHVAPRPDDQAMAIGLAAIGMQPALSGRDDESAILDGAGPHQHIPVRFARGHGERGRDGESKRALLRQPAIELRKAQIVTDRHAEETEFGIGQHARLAAFDLAGFAVALALRHLHIEQVNLVIARPHRAIGSEQERPVGGLGVRHLDVQRADQQPDFQVFGERAECRKGRIVRLIEGGIQLGAIIFGHDVGVFRSGDKTSALPGRLAHQSRCAADILRHITRRAKLDAGSLKRNGTGHAFSITDPAPF